MGTNLSQPGPVLLPYLPKPGPPAGRAFAIATVPGAGMTELFTGFPAVPHARPC